MAEPEDQTAAQHLQEEAAKLLSDVKCIYRTSQKAIDRVVSGVDTLTDINIEVTKDLLKRKLSDDDGYLYLSQVNAVLDSQRGQSLFEGVKSSKSLDAFMALKAGVESEEKLMQIILDTHFTTRNGKPVSVPKDYGYYIPFLPQLEQLLNCPEVLNFVLHPEPAPKGVYRSITDGLYYKHHFIVKLHGNKVLAIIIYCDDVEFADPCKSKTKMHRLRLYYWSLGNIPSKFRSTLKAINLLAIVKTSMVKKYGNEPFLDDFVKDMIKLGNGVCFSISGKEYIFYGILLCSCGDMPAQANLGGFKETHFALRPCRHCMGLRSTLCDSFAEDKTLLRNITDHNKYVKEVESYTPPSKMRRVCVPVIVEDASNDEPIDDLLQENNTQEYNDHDDPSVNYGINKSSILSLAPGFDATKCFPIDILHTLHEGILNDLCRLLLRDLCLTQKDSSGKIISKPKYSLKFLSDFIKDRCDFGHLNVNKPSEIEKGHLSKKLKQSAAQMYVLGHILPFFTRNNLPDEKHQLLLQLLKILDITMLFEVKEEDILELEKLVVDFGTSFVAVYPKYKTLKLHSLRHLGMLGRLFGGFRQVWCFRFEAMHRLLTSLVDVVNNMKNIELTMATRYILRRDTELVSGRDGNYLYQGDTFSGLQVLQQNEVCHGDLIILRSLCIINEETVIKMAKTMEKKGSRWSENVIFVRSCNGTPSFGLIKKIYILNDEVIFLYSNLKTKYEDNLNAYCILAVCGDIAAQKFDLLTQPYPVARFCLNYPRRSVSYLILVKPTDI